MRICSLLPGATETVAALGLADHLVGISHECDYPPGLSAPILVQPVIRSEDLSSEEIDRRVRAAASENRDLYTVSEVALAAARPELVILQDLCDVCAVTPTQAERALSTLTPPPRLLKLHPQRLSDIFADILRIGEAVDRKAEAAQLTNRLQQALETTRQRTHASRTRPRVACLEWLDPLYIAGHWVPDMVDLAGGIAVLNDSGVASRRITWDELTASSPDAVVIMPCGFTKERALIELKAIADRPEWLALPAVRSGRVQVVDALSYFSRPGPRLVDGVLQLAAFLHPEAPAVETAKQRPPTSGTH
ncbi:MAG TPA: cobalamin-binding protein [Nitrospiraceae bacterium]|nr:cobalamin-binding protein [Nitrospiraceae bacterium]